MNLPVYKCKALPADLVLDGKVNKPAWKDRPAIKLVRTVDGRPPRQQTWAKYGWTQTHLWAAYHCDDTHIVANYTEHDTPDLWSENVVEIFLDPLATGRVYYEFQVNCRNVTFDGIVHNASGAAGVGPDRGLQCLTAWNPASFQSCVTGKGKFNGTAEKDEYWDVELRIGFADLWMVKKNPPQPGDQWRFNAFRVDSGPWGQELYAWNPTVMLKFHVSDLFGIMEFAL